MTTEIDETKQEGTPEEDLLGLFSENVISSGLFRDDSRIRKE